MQGQITRIYPTESDRRNLSLLRVQKPHSPGAFDYRNIVVKKPWGYEYLMFENDFVAVWILFLKKGSATSMHCHPRKKTSLVVLDGQITCSTLEGWHDLKSLEGLIIEKGVFHSTQALSSSGTFIMEVEAPPLKEDLARLKDKYGRAGKAYEGEDKMSKNTKKYNYIDFHQKKTPQKLKDTTVQIVTKQELFNPLAQFPDALVCLLKGSVDISDKEIMGIGEIIPLEKMQALDKKNIHNSSEFLIIAR